MNRKSVFIIVLAIMLVASLLMPFITNAQGPENKLTKIPEPLSDPSQAVSDSTSYLNIADPKHPGYADFVKEPPKRILPTTYPGRTLPENEELGASGTLYVNHNQWGSGIAGSQNITGAFAGHEARPDLNLPYIPPGGESIYLYAPTLIGPDYCPVESVTYYRRLPGAANTERSWGVWDHTIGNFVVLKTMDANFLNKYVRNFPEWGGQLYYTEILKSGNNWYVYLFNFSTGLWEIQYTRVGGAGFWRWGWDQWEIYRGNDWPTGLPGIDASGVKVYVNGTWQLNTPPYGYQVDVMGSGCPYRRIMFNPYHRWYVGP